MSSDYETPIFKAQYLMGFLESLEVSDSISKMQIQKLKSKIEELIIAVQNEFEEDQDVNDISQFEKDNNDQNKPNLADDLPF